MRVVIDGAEYAPVGEVSPKIGVAIATHNRPEVFEKTRAAWEKYLPEGAVLVVVDDASDIPVKGADFRFEKNAGIARTKNKGIELLMDAGVEHLFLGDDDVYPTSADWWKPYVDSAEPHLMLAWGDEHFRTNSLVGYQWAKGCMLYATRRVIERVGGMDPVFGKWGIEHVSWSERIHNAGLTTVRFGDVPGSDKLFHALDRNGEIETSVALEDRLAANVQAGEDFRDSDGFVPYREAPKRRGYDLSILVPSVHTRRETFAPKIMDQLFGQYESLSAVDQGRVEILMLTDTKSRILGDKRNRMVDLAQGEYVVFVDDDDRIEPDYISTILGATESGADALTFLAAVSLNGGAPKTCRYSIRYAEDANTSTEYHRIPNHITAVRRELAQQAGFPASLKGEDAAYAIKLRPLLKTEHHIDRVLYHYDYNAATTETQQPDRVMEAKPPIVDVVFLSNASTPELRQMTEQAIATCRAGAAGHTVNIIVMEQTKTRYKDTVTLYTPEKFAYNAFANRGAATGTAPWIMIANSDLEFHDGWLDALLEAKHDLVSPASPGNARQDVKANETGDVNGKHLSGWCFLISRELWKRIGGLDEDLTFWACDNALVEQAKAVGVLPMLVPASKVTHLISKTIGGTTKADDPNDDGEMTWAQIRIFNKKYGKSIFAGDARYKAWQAKHPE